MLSGPVEGVVLGLAAEESSSSGDVRVGGYEDAAFAGGDLFVGIEGERGGVAEGSNFFPAHFGAQGFAGVFDYSEFVAAGNLTDGVDFCGIAEGVDYEDGTRARADGGFDGGWCDVERAWIDVDEDWGEAFL